MVLWFLYDVVLGLSSSQETNGGRKKNKEKENYTYRPYMAISILCSIGFIPRELFVAESKGRKILCLCDFGEKK